MDQCRGMSKTYKNDQFSQDAPGAALS